MASLKDSIKCLKGIGEKKALSFAKIGVFSLYDLVNYFPKRYEDRSQFKQISDIKEGEKTCISGVIATEPRLVRLKRGLDMVKFRVADDTGWADITYFNQSWLKNSLFKGDEYCFYGTATLSGGHIGFINPVCESESRVGNHTGRIIPVYRLTSGISQNEMHKYVNEALNLCISEIPEIIPDEVLYANGFPDRRTAIKNIHLPGDYDSLLKAQKRLTYEEIFVLSVALATVKKRNTGISGYRLSNIDSSEFFSSLPYLPTKAQERTIKECLDDMSSGRIMNRLLQGDVGSGKTLVAAVLIFSVYKCGLCSALMVPTEILAQQHYKTMTSLLDRFGIRIALLTGSTPEKSKAEIRSLLKAGKIDLIIGTHSLFSENMEYSNLALVVTDEQHRFGVNQRAAIISKGNSPHVLVMSATPIPRTLALIIYGDLDISVIDEMPPGRQTVDTFFVNESYRKRLDAFILKQISNGNQVYIVCPKIDEDDGDESILKLKSAEEYTAELKGRLTQARIACVHGKMKAEGKNSVMASFVQGNIDILVSTTVIEVGVDVPNATLIIIENAERFGLSQLHQLRGRVGRGKDKSYCILVSDSQNIDSRARLDVMCRTNDGFKISEEDLKLRGPGDFFGSRQHGLPCIHLPSGGVDAELIKTAQNDAYELLKADPELTLPTHNALKEYSAEFLANGREILN